MTVTVSQHNIRFKKSRRRLCFTAFEIAGLISKLYLMCHGTAHAHANFVSRTTKPLPNSAANTDYETLTMTTDTTQYSAVQVFGLS